MAIYRKDRSFDRIFEEVTLDKIPMDYVNNIKLTLKDGSSVILDKQDFEGYDEPHEFVNTRDDIRDISISLDYEKIKEDISSNINGMMTKLFKTDD